MFENIVMITSGTVLHFFTSITFYKRLTRKITRSLLCVPQNSCNLDKKLKIGSPLHPRYTTVCVCDLWNSGKSYIHVAPHLSCSCIKFCRQERTTFFRFSIHFPKVQISSWSLNLRPAHARFKIIIFDSGRYFKFSNFFAFPLERRSRLKEFMLSLEIYITHPARGEFFSLTFITYFESF